MQVTEFDELERWALLIIGDRSKNISTRVVRNWSSSRVICIETSRGNYFAKACAPHCQQELACTIQIAKQLPSCVPAILALDESKRWLLYYKFGDAIIANPSREAWLTAANTWAKAQSDSQSVLLSLTAWPKSRNGNCKLCTVFNGMNESFSPLAEKLNKLAKVARQIEHLPIPQTIVHGDLSAGNILINNGEIRFIDWSECFIGSPLLDALYFLIANRHHIEKTSCSYHAIRMALIEPWQNYIQFQELLSLFDEAYSLSSSIYLAIKGMDIKAHGDLDGIATRRKPLLMSVFTALLNIE